MTSTFPSYPGGYTIPTFLDFVLQSVVDEYESRSIGLPERRYWMVGQPAFDCNQVVVNATTLNLGLPENAQQLTSCDSGWTLEFFVTVLRCSPVSGTRSAIPAAEAIQAAAAETAADMEILMDLTKRLDVARTGISASVEAVGPEGGTQGAVGTYAMGPYVYP